MHPPCRLNVRLVFDGPCNRVCPCCRLGLIAFYGFFIGSILVRC